MSIFSKLFGSSKKDFTYQGTKPVTSLSQVQGGPEYYKTITDRLAGRGVGFGDTYAEKYSNPIIQNSRNQFSSYQIPELMSELTVSGRRRGSGGFDQIRRAYQEQGLNENDIFSKLQMRNEDQMRNEINDALGRVGDYADNEANLVSKRAAFDYDDHSAQVGREQDRMSKEAQGYQNLLSAGADLLSGQPPIPKPTQPITSINYSGYNPSAPGMNVGYGKSGKTMNQRLLQRLALR